MKSIVIANCGGFWGDDPKAAGRQVRGGPIDYLVMDYLAEVTMAILHKQMARDPEKGYAPILSPSSTTCSWKRWKKASPLFPTPVV